MRGVAVALFFVLVGLAAPVGPSDRVSVSEASRATCQRRRRRAPVRPRVTAAQRRQIRRWHTRATRHELDAWRSTSPLALVFRPLHGAARFVLTPEADTGGFDEEDLGLAEQALAFRDDGSTHPIHPRLVELVYAAVRHFRVPYVYVISGYRSGRPSSRHAQGRAIDLVLPGVTDRRLAAWLRPQGFVGVGIYPTSGFVHLDVRGRSHFWSDTSGPDQRNRERPILRALGPRYDRAARARGVTPLADIAETTESEDESLEAPALGASDPDAGSSDASVDAGTPAP